MSEVKKVWEKFLTMIIKNTFGEFIDDEEIKKRVNLIYSKIYTIEPEKLYKNLLYIMNNNSLSEIAIGYKIHFLLDVNYEDLFMNPYSEEFDKNSSLTNNDKELIEKFISNFSIIVNHHIELMIHNQIVDGELNSLNMAILQLSDFYEIPKADKIKPMLVKNGIFSYTMNFSQILYTVAFDKNPFSGEGCDEILSTFIREKYPHRLIAMESLKETWPSGIPLEYVRSYRLF